MTPGFTTTIAEVRKRDGRIVPFDRLRIEGALLKAANAVGDFEARWVAELSEEVARRLEAAFAGRQVPGVEDIQDLVEEALIRGGHTRVAKAYILYREQRSQAREANRLLLDGMHLVDDYLRQADWRVNENSNMTYSLQGLNFHLASAISARYWLHKIYPPEVRERHVEGDFHLHDLGMLAPYCCGWDLQDLLREGFRGVPGKVESRPPRHFSSALGQMVNFFYTMQGEAAGAQAVSSFDTLLAPLVRRDGLSYERVKQAMQEFLFNLNVPTRVGFQTPFTNLTMDLTPPRTLRGAPAIVGGQALSEPYGDFQAEMDMINRAFAEVMLEGDAGGRIFTFPIPTYNIHREFNWENPVLEPIWEVTSKYGIPYFSNFVSSDMDPEDARSMCCRLRLDNRELRKRGGGLFGANPLTGSIGVVTINMARLGYLSSDEEECFDRLGRLMETARASLEIKRKVLEGFVGQGLYPYTRHYLEDVHRRFGSYWANHFSTIGVSGVNEACLNLLGVGIGHPQGKGFAVRALRFMRDRLADFQEETGNLYNLEATPAEGAAYRLAKADRERFPDIVTAGTAEAPFYTNSTHLPVEESEDAYATLLHQDDLQVLYTGGTVLHIFLGERIEDWRLARELVKRIVHRFRLPYFTLTPTFSVCPVHGYIPGEHWECPCPTPELSEVA